MSSVTKGSLVAKKSASVWAAGAVTAVGSGGMGASQAKFYPSQRRIVAQLY